MKNKTSFDRLLEKLNRDLTSGQNDAIEENITLPEGKDYDIDSLMADVSQMREDMKKGIFEMHDSKLHQEESFEEEFENKKPNRLDLPPQGDQRKVWEKGNAKINETMKVYNDQKKQSYKNEQELDTFKRLMGYEIPKDKGRIKESKMWSLPKNQDRLVVILDKEEALLVKQENFDFSKLDESKQVNASQAGHSLNVFNQLFETWYEYDSEDFEKLI